MKTGRPTTPNPKSSAKRFQRSGPPRKTLEGRKDAPSPAGSAVVPQTQLKLHDLDRDTMESVIRKLSWVDRGAVALASQQLSESIAAYIKSGKATGDRARIPPGKGTQIDEAVKTGNFSFVERVLTGAQWKEDPDLLEHALEALALAVKGDEYRRQMPQASDILADAVVRLSIAPNNFKSVFEYANGLVYSAVLRAFRSHPSDRLSAALDIMMSEPNRYGCFMVARDLPEPGLVEKFSDD